MRKLRRRLGDWRWRRKHPAPPPPPPTCNLCGREYAGSRARYPVVTSRGYREVCQRCIGVVIDRRDNMPDAYPLL